MSIKVRPNDFYIKSQTGEKVSVPVFLGAQQNKEQILNQLRQQMPTDEHINSLIDDKVGVIENGRY